MIMFSMLLFSSMVSAVSSLYLSSDNEILYSAPIPERQLFGMRFLTSFLYTSWMMVIFSLPIFGAYGTIFHADILYYPLLMLAVLSTALTANAVGLAATILLVRLFPAKQTKDIAVYLSMLFGILLYLVIRLMRPEEMADPDRFPDFIEYLSSMQTPALSLLPPAWANQLLNVYLQDRLIDWTAVGLLLLTPIVLYWGGEWLMERFFAGGFSKAQESFGGYHTFTPKPYHPSPLLRIFHKEAKLFLRDSSEWSQLFLVGALIVVYLYNFKVESRAAVQGSFGAILFLFCGLAAQLLILVLGFMGNFRLLKAWLLWNQIDSLGVLFSCLTIAGLAALTLFFSLWCVRKGIRTLEG